MRTSTLPAGEAAHLVSLSASETVARRAARDVAERSTVVGRALIVLVVLQLVSALTFIATQRTPVFDDAAALRDVERYAAEGLSPASLARHENAAGPLGYWWMATVGSALGGGLAAYRVGALLAFSILCAVLACAALREESRGLWTLVSVVTLTSVYIPTAAATLLTEPLALALAIGASLLWVLPGDRLIAPIVGGLFAGLACVIRQYYVALLPALLAAWVLRPSGCRREMAARLVGVVLAVAPIALLGTFWGGMTSPMLRNGLSSPEHVHTLSLSPVRPLVCALLLGLGTFPFLLSPRASWPRRYALLAIVPAVALAVAAPHLWRFSNPARDTGPVDRVVALAATWGGAPAAAVSAAFAWLGILGWLNVGSRARTRWCALRQEPAAMVGLVTVCAYVAGQVFVGGTDPYYQRYDLQMAPFLALLVAPLFGSRLTPLQLGWFGCTALVGQAMLWRHAW